MTDKPTCPICGKPYIGAPAVSRTDNKTLICPDCGTMQALEAIGVTNRDAVLARIHEYEARRAQKEEQA